MLGPNRFKYSFKINEAESVYDVTRNAAMSYTTRVTKDLSAHTHTHTRFDAQAHFLHCRVTMSVLKGIHK